MDRGELNTIANFINAKHAKLMEYPVKYRSVYINAIFNK